MNTNNAQTAMKIDWRDIRFALVLGIVTIFLKMVTFYIPSWHFSRTTGDIALTTFTVGYILARARRMPHQLDQWGLTTVLTPAALLTGLSLLVFSVLVLAGLGFLIAGGLIFEPVYMAEMIEYIPAAFPQQFVLCSVGLVSLASLSAFRGTWRLPLLVGALFSLAHFWTPVRIPGTIVPVQMLITLPAGAGAAWYFLRFRNILPLTVIHAVLYPLMHHWIERQL